MIDGNRLGDVGFEKLGTPYSEMDCQAFIEWCLRKCGLNKDLAGSNAWYREVLKYGAVMTPEECVRQLGCVPKGAFLFILEFDGGEEKRGYHDGLGNASHIGICTMPRGKGAIHSSASRGCVAESDFKGKTIPNGGWNRVGLYTKEVAYDYSGDTPVPTPVPGPSPEPEPTPAPAPVQEFAEVWSENGKPVNSRKGPDETYPLSKAGKIPVGSVVEVLEHTVNKQGEGWSKVSYTDQRDATWKCWIKDDFLIELDQYDEPVNVLYTITIRHLSEQEANALLSVYPDAEKEEEGG